VAVSYEWKLEMVDIHGDIVDVDHSDSLQEAVNLINKGWYLNDGVVKVEIVLTRWWQADEDDWFDTDRSYAYVTRTDDDGFIIQDHFDCGTKVPNKYKRLVLGIDTGTQI
jgi:hypothetical protein